MTEEPRATLLPCPHCGEAASLVLGVAGFWCECSFCAVHVAETESEAIAAWNRRATPAVRDGLVERLYGTDPDRVTLLDRLRLYTTDPATFPLDAGDAEEIAELCEEAAAALSLRPAETRVKELTDDEIMEVIRECAPWKTEPALNDLLTYEKSPPLFPQATYDVPSYRATKLVRAIEKRIKASISEPARAEEGKEPVAWPKEDLGDGRWVDVDPVSLARSAPSSSTLEITEEAVEAAVDAFRWEYGAGWKDDTYKGVRAALEASLPFFRVGEKE